MIKSIVFLLSCLFMVMLGGCKDPVTTDPVTTDPVISDSLITISYPAGGEIFTIGETIDIGFCFDVLQVGGVGVSISLNGRVFTPLVSKSIVSDKDSGRDCKVFSYIIPDDLITEPNDKVQIKVWQYTDPDVEVTSAAFTIKP